MHGEEGLLVQQESVALVHAARSALAARADEAWTPNRRRLRRSAAAAALAARLALHVCLDSRQVGADLALGAGSRRAGRASAWGAQQPGGAARGLEGNMQNPRSAAAAAAHAVGHEAAAAAAGASWRRRAHLDAVLDQPHQQPGLRSHKEGVGEAARGGACRLDAPQPLERLRGRGTGVRVHACGVMHTMPRAATCEAGLPHAWQGCAAARTAGAARACRAGRPTEG